MTEVTFKFRLWEVSIYPRQILLRKTCGQRLSSKQKDYVVDVEVNGGEQLSVSKYICESGSFSSHLGYWISWVIIRR